MQDLLIANFSPLPEDAWRDWFSRNLAAGVGWTASPAEAPSNLAVADNRPLVMIYAPLDQAMLQAFLAGGDAGVALRDWERLATAILEFWRPRRQGVLLVPSDLLAGDPEPLRTALGRWRDLPLAEPGETAGEDMVTPAVMSAPALWHLIARQPALLSRRLRRLCDELAAGGPARPGPAEDLSPVLAAAAEVAALEAAKAEAASGADRLRQQAAHERADIQSALDAARADARNSAEEAQVEHDRLQSALEAVRAEARNSAEEANQRRKEAQAEHDRLQSALDSVRVEARNSAEEANQRRKEAQAEHDRLQSALDSVRVDLAAGVEAGAILRKEAEIERSGRLEAERQAVLRMAALKEQFANERREVESRATLAIGSATERAEVAAAQLALVKADNDNLKERIRGLEEMMERDFRAGTELALAQKQNTALEQQIRTLNEAAAETGQRIDVLSKECGELSQRAEDHERRVADLLASTSWRITSPMRATKLLFGRLIRRQ